MTYLIVLGFYFTALFVIGFASRRSMGVPALALTAGAILAKLWTENLTPIVAQAGVVIIQPPLASLVGITLTLVPALIILARASKVTSHYHGIFGSLVFAVLGVMLTYGAFSNAVVMDEGSRNIVMEMLKYERIIITVAIVLALFEVLFYKTPHPYAMKSKK